jgi:HEAT repeat protein
MDDVSTLTDRLNSGDLVERQDAAERLSQLGEEASAAAVPLVRACGDADESVREWSAAALEGLGTPDVGDLGELLRLLDDPHEDVGYWSATLVGRMGPAAAAAVSPLAHSVARHPAAAVRQRSVWALGRIGPAAKSAASVLREASASDDARLANLARKALEQIGGGSS